MPLYEYECDACAHRFERIQKFSDPLIDTCPKCAGHVHKLFSSPAIQFKGSGFYINDYPKKGSDAGGAKTGDSSNAESKSSDSKSSDSKSSDSTSSDSKGSGSSGSSDSGGSSSSTASTSDSKASAKTESK